MPGGARNAEKIEANKIRIKKGDIKLVSGHGYFGDLAHVRDDVLHFTFLRHPNARLQSEINYLCSEEKGSKILRVIKKHDANPNSIAREIASSRDKRLLYLDNISIRQICGDIPFDRLIDERDLEKAINTLTNQFCSYYITEIFVESLLLMAKKYNLLPPLFISVNRSKHFLPYIDLDAEKTQIIKYDTILYDFFREQFLRSLPKEIKFISALKELNDVSKRIGNEYKEWAHKPYRVGSDPIIKPKNYRDELENVVSYLRS